MASDNAPIGSERRRERRLGYRMHVILGLGNHSAELLTEDISRRGLFLRTDEPLEMRCLVRVTIPSLPPQGLSLAMHGTVAHVVRPGDSLGRVPGIGIHFFALGDRALRRWDKFVRTVERHHPEVVQAVVVEDAAAKVVPERIRRHHVRSLVELPVQLKTAEDAVEMYARDLSEGGTFLNTDAELSPGDSCVVVVIHPQSGERIDLHGIVQWRSTQGARPGIGIRFLELDEAVHARFLSVFSDLMQFPAGIDFERVEEGDPRLA